LRRLHWIDGLHKNPDGSFIFSFHCADQSTPLNGCLPAIQFRGLGATIGLVEKPKTILTCFNFLKKPKRNR
jgi:hypothetical protein